MRLLLFLIFLLTVSQSQSFELTKDSLKEFSICTDNKKLGCILQKKLQKIIDYSLPVVSLDECSYEKVILLEKCEDCDDIKTEEGFIIKKEYNQSQIEIKGKTEEGVLYGIYTFLEKIGYKKFSPNYETIPEDFYISELDIEENPAFEYREIFVKEANNPYFAESFLLNGRLGHRTKYPLRFGNKFFFLISLKDLFDDIENYQCGNQIDFTNKDAVHEAVESLREILDDAIKNKKGSISVLISPNDINDYCRNSSSLERIQEGKSPATPYIDFVSHIAQDLKDEFPDVKFFALAYHWSRKPPENYQKLPENMGVLFSTIEADFSKPLLIRNNTYILKDLLNWRKYTDTIYVWHYITNFSNYLIPFPDIYQIADDIKYFSKIPEVKGIFLQGAYDTFGSDMVDIKLYLFSKLMWNPSLDIDRLLEETLKNLYGSAWEDIQEYIDTLYLYVKGPKVPMYVKTQPEFIKGEIINKLFSILKSAQEHIEEDRLINLEKIKLGFYILALLNENKIDNNIVKDVRKNLPHLLKKFKVSHYAEGKNIDSLKKLLKVHHINNNISFGIESSEKKIDFQEFSLKLCCSEIIKDRLASNRLAVAVYGSKDDWAIQLDLNSLPEGNWDIYAVVRTQVKDGTDPEDKIAFRYGIYPLDIVEEAPLEDFIDGEYHVVYIGTFSNKNYTVWIAPPGKDYVEYLLVDKIFAVKKDE